MPTFLKIFLFGIDKSGKTTLSQTLRTGKYGGDAFPTTRFDIQSMFIHHFEKAIEFRVWDAPGQISYRDVWNEGYEQSHIMVFVLDTAEKERYEQAKKALNQVINAKATLGVPLLFLFHKIDLTLAKNNYYAAQDFFKPSLIITRDVYQLHTSVKDQGTMDNVKEILAFIVKKDREFKWSGKLR
ncbi:MAG: ADP-ribosylation factor-like protein [Candidatus Hodarchaeota archaeon]